jgi:hypothetical protein
VKTAPTALYGPSSKVEKSNGVRGWIKRRFLYEIQAKSRETNPILGGGRARYL